VVKLLVGILKGAVIGAALGYGAAQVDLFPMWLVCALIGVVVGLFVGRPIWSLITDKNATTFSAVLKAGFGFGIGVGLYALVHNAMKLSLVIADHDVFAWAPTLGGAIGAVYGGFVELDDAIGDDGGKAKSGKAAAKPAKKQLAKPGAGDDDAI
jgi:hypothetical protein